MAIEFNCTQCNKLLRVQDASAGKKAKCPECGAILQIPQAASQPVAAGFAPPTGEAANPYQSPSPVTEQAPAVSASGEIVPTRIDAMDVFGHTWAIFKRQWGMALGAVLIANFASQAASNILGVIGAQMDDGVGIATVILTFAAMAFGLFLTIGQDLILLGIARGRQVSLGELFSGGPFFVPTLLATILYFLATFAGTLLLIIPGIVVALMFWPYFFLIIDKNLSVMDSLRVSREITQGNKMTLFGMGIMAFGVVLAGFLACGVGLLVAIPYVSLILAVAYLKMAGQEVAPR